MRSNSRLFGPKYTMFSGGLFYVLYLCSSIKLIDWLYLSCGALLGIAAGPMWVSQGIFIQLSCNQYEMENNFKLNEKLGHFNGIFSFGYLMSKFIGNLCAAILFDYNESNSVLYAVLAVATLFGSLIFLCINDENTRSVYPASITKMQNNSDNTDIITCSNNNTIDYNQHDELELESISYKDIFLVIKDPKFKYLLLICFECGVFTAWIPSDFAELIDADNIKFYVLSIEGLIGGLGSIFVGYMSDKFSPLVVFIIANIPLLIVMIFLMFWNIEQSS